MQHDLVGAVASAAPHNCLSGRVQPNFLWDTPQWVFKLPMELPCYGLALHFRSLSTRFHSFKLAWRGREKAESVSLLNKQVCTRTL